MKTFSIVIPAIGDASLFEHTLASVLRYQPANSQVIVVHSEAYQDSHELAGEGVELVSIENRSNMIPFFNAGVKKATGEFVAFIRPGIELKENWQVPVIEAFEDDQVGSVSPIICADDKAGRPVVAGVGMASGFKRKLLRSESEAMELLSPTSWAGFYRRNWLSALFDEVESIDSTLDSVYLDIELGLCLYTLGLDCELATDCVVTIPTAATLFEESRVPHGMSAQRSYCRHVLLVGTTASQVQSTLAKLGEVLTSPFAPWKLKHAGQRSEAGRFRDRDEVFSDDLSVVARKLKRMELQAAVQLKVYSPELDEADEAAQFEAAQRNAMNMVSEKRKKAQANSPKSKRRAA